MASEAIYGPAERELFPQHPELAETWKPRLQKLLAETERDQRTLVAQFRKARRRTQIAHQFIAEVSRAVFEAWD